jgi:hypothetical protein
MKDNFGKEYDLKVSILHLIGLHYSLLSKIEKLLVDLQVGKLTKEFYDLNEKLVSVLKQRGEVLNVVGDLDLLTIKNLLFVIELSNSSLNDFLNKARLGNIKHFKEISDLQTEFLEVVKVSEKIISEINENLPAKFKPI